MCPAAWITDCVCERSGGFCGPNGTLRLHACTEGIRSAITAALAAAGLASEPTLQTGAVDWQQTRKVTACALASSSLKEFDYHVVLTLPKE